LVVVVKRLEREEEEYQNSNRNRKISTSSGFRSRREHGKR
jgi:hypothetical protein